MREIMTTTGALQDIVDAQVRAMFEKSNEEQASELYYKQLGLNDYFPDVPEEQMNDITGPDKGVITIEGQEYGSTGKTRGYPITVTLRKYTAKLEWTEEDVHWLAKQSSSKRISTLRNASVGMVNSLQENINEDTSKVFYLGFGTTFLNVGNSEALFGSHNLRGAGIQRNDFGLGNTHLALNSGPLVTAIEKMNRFQAHNGNQLKRVRKLLLLVSVEEIANANQLIFSMYGPKTANLGESQSSSQALARRGMTVEAVEVPGIPSAYSTYWFLNSIERARERAFMAWAWKPKISRDDQASKGTLRMLASTYFGPAILGWSWTLGSKGDGSII